MKLKVPPNFKYFSVYLPKRFKCIHFLPYYSESVSRRMIADLTSALQYLHDKMIVHRDIKPENLLVVNLTKSGLNDRSEAKKSLKLGDFGLAQLVSEPLFTVCGTPTYVAPEILAETGYGVKVDVWATGVIMYILLLSLIHISEPTRPY